MNFFPCFLILLLLSPSLTVHQDPFHVPEIDDTASTGSRAVTIGRRLKQRDNHLRITKGRYDGDFFNHDDIVIAFDAGSQISGIYCALIRDPDVVTVINPCTSPIHLDTYLEVDGLYGFAVIGKDDISQQRINDTNAFVVDRTPPRTHLFDVEQDSQDMQFKFDAEDAWDAENFECRLDASDWEQCSSPKSYKVGLGDHVFKVRAIDPAGNRDINPAHHEWTVLHQDLRTSLQSNSESEDKNGSSRMDVVMVAIFVPLAVVMLVGIVILLNRKKLASVMDSEGRKNGMMRIP